MASALEFFFELFEILDDAIMNDQDPARAIRMRMRVDFIRHAVGGPAGVRNANGTCRNRMRLEERLEVFDLAAGLVQDDFSVIVGDNADAA